MAGSPDREILTKLTEGVWLAEGKVRAKRVRVVGTKGEATVLEMVLAEGKNREVRRMLAKLGHKVMTLTRVAVGPITLKGLAPGEYRPLSSHEVELLHKVAEGIVVTPVKFAEPKPSRGPAGQARPAPPGRPRREAGARPTGASKHRAGRTTRGAAQVARGAAAEAGGPGRPTSPRRRRPSGRARSRGGRPASRADARRSESVRRACPPRSADRRRPPRGRPPRPAPRPRRGGLSAWTWSPRRRARRLPRPRRPGLKPRPPRASLGRGGPGPRGGEGEE